MVGTIITTFVQEEVKGECDASQKWSHQLREKIILSASLFWFLNSIECGKNEDLSVKGLLLIFLT